MIKFGSEVSENHGVGFCCGLDGAVVVLILSVGGEKSDVFSAEGNFASRHNCFSGVEGDGFWHEDVHGLKEGTEDSSTFDVMVGISGVSWDGGCFLRGRGVRSIVGLRVRRMAIGAVGVVKSTQIGIIVLRKGGVLLGTFIGGGSGGRRSLGTMKRVFSKIVTAF